MKSFIRRNLSASKIPPPNFEYAQFARWLGVSPPNFSIEIGCGVGYHPIQWAKNNPGGKILAIERTKNKFDKFSSRLRNHANLTNIFSAHADAAHLLPHLRISRLVDNFFVLYPNPYPKSKHANLRFAYSPLTHFMIDNLKIGGRLIFATNIEEYASELNDEIPKHPGMELEEMTTLLPLSSLSSPPPLSSLSSPPPLPSLSSPPPQPSFLSDQRSTIAPTCTFLEPRSHFEKKYITRGDICYNLVFRRVP